MDSTEPMTPERGYRLAVERLRQDTMFVREKLDEGVHPMEVAGRLAIGFSSDPQVTQALPGLLAVALVLLTTAEVLDATTEP